MLQNPYFITFVISLLLNSLFFLVAYLFKTDKFTDFTYGLSFIVITIFLFTQSDWSNIQKQLVAIMIIIWAIRLITYLVLRIQKIKKDSRFDNKREDFFAFLQFWIFQALAVWIIMLPATYFLTIPNSPQIKNIMLLGSLTWFIGLIIETIADIQKFNFKNNPKNKDLWIESGIWQYSRHPNYFGEMLIWWGIFIFISPTLSLVSWVTILGPLFITFILLFVSGIPLLEQKYDKKYNNNKDYQRYKKETSLLIPLPHKVVIIINTYKKKTS